VPPTVWRAVKTLVVDDQEDIRLLITTIIRAFNQGLTVSCEAQGGAEALDRLDACDPDIVVLDHMMPGMTGIETAQRIRERRPGLPMVLCSAYLDDDLRASAAEVGFGMCVSKTDVTRLPDAILAVLGR